MNDPGLHDFFRRQEERMHNPSTMASDDTQEANFDNFITSKSGAAYGFYIEEDFNLPDGQNWSAVVWVPKTMIESVVVDVRRLPNQGGFVVTMPVWWALKKGVI